MLSVCDVSEDVMRVGCIVGLGLCTCIILCFLVP